MTKKQQKQLADTIDDLRFKLAHTEKMKRLGNEYSARLDRALEDLMRDVLAEVIGPFARPNSIACGRLIAAVAKASETIHGRSPESTQEPRS